MRLVIMQPYFFPYLGYFQLLHAAERVVFYDDVNYIKNGWINRNRMLLRGAPHFFTVPLENASPFVPICDVRFNAEDARWRRKMLGTFAQAYKAAPFYADGIRLVEQVLDVANGSIADLARESVLAVMRYMDIKRSVQTSSAAYGNAQLKGAARVLDISRREGALTYINAPGGRCLYKGEDFRDAGVELKFIAAGLRQYPQLGPGFVPALSILDAIMWCGSAGVGGMLTDYRLER